jgi:hypothetical protein
MAAHSGEAVFLPLPVPVRAATAVMAALAMAVALATAAVMAATVVTAAVVVTAAMAGEIRFSQDFDLWLTNRGEQ